MINKYTFLALLILSVNTLLAQNWEWAQRVGNIKSDKITAIKTDGLGYIYIAGYFSNSSPIGTNNLMLNFTANNHSKEAFIAKLDSTGYCYWAKSGGEYFDDRVLGMDVDSLGNSIIVGTYWSNNFVMGSLTINNTGFGGSDQCFVVKHDPNGNQLWGTFVAGNSGDDQGLDVAIDKNGNGYIVGFMSGNTLKCGGNTVTASNSNTNSQQHSYWLAKINSGGTFQWARTFGNLPYDTTVSKYIERDIAVCVDEKDGVYVTGGFDHTWPFGNTTLTSSGGYDIFVMKYDTSGNFAWSTQGGSRKDDWSNGICSDKNGSIYVTGEHRDSLIMDTIIVKNYDKRDAFLLKLDATTGKPIWGKRAGGDFGGERGNDVWADENCNVYVCGDINDSSKFGDNLPINTGKDVQAFVARITPDGKWIWVQTGGGTDENDRCNAVAKGKGNQLYVGGFFRSPANYGASNLASAGSSDAFFARLYDSSLNKGLPFILNIPSKLVLCNGDSSKLSIPDHGSLYINPGIGYTTNSDTTKITFKPTVTTTYTIWGSSEGLCSESDTISFTITVSTNDFKFPILSDSIICSGEKVTYFVPENDFFSITPTNGVSYNSDSSEIYLSPTMNTSYKLFGYKLGICPRYDSLSFSIYTSPSPTADFEILPAIALIQNPVFSLQNLSFNANKYWWYNSSNTLFSTSTNTLVREDSAGDYCYKLIAETFDGCKDSVVHCAKIIDDERVFFPNAFSPNNDQLNEEFKPLLINISTSSIKNYSFKVINRYGQIVYETSNPLFGWDGKYKGATCEIGTYFYVCSFILNNEKKYDVKGDVTLLR